MFKRKEKNLEENEEIKELDEQEEQDEQEDDEEDEEKKENKFLKSVSSGFSKVGSGIADGASKVGSGIAEGASKVGSGIADGASAVTSKTQEAIMGALDVNGDGELDMQDIITLSLKIKGVLVDRAEFLRETFSNYSADIVETAVSKSPQIADIPPKKLNKIAHKVSKQKNKFLSSVATKHLMPKKISRFASIPTEITLYYAHVLYTIQKLMYLYGFPQIKNEENEKELPLETITIFSICLGTMYEAEGANTALKTVAKGIADGAEGEELREILNGEECSLAMANTNKWFAVNIVRGILGKVARSAVPVVGGIVGGVIASDSLMTDFDALEDTLAETTLCNQT